MCRASLTLLVLAILNSISLAEPPPIVATDKYHVVPNWPKVPEGFKFGQVPGVGVDSHNHVFVFHRSDPPVLCFDGETGKLIASWGSGMINKAHGLSIDQ